MQYYAKICDNMRFFYESHNLPQPCGSNFKSNCALKLVYFTKRWYAGQWGATETNQKAAPKILLIMRWRNHLAWWMGRSFVEDFLYAYTPAIPPPPKRTSAPFPPPLLAPHALGTGVGHVEVMEGHVLHDLLLLVHVPWGMKRGGRWKVGGEGESGTGSIPVNNGHIMKLEIHMNKRKYAQTLRHDSNITCEIKNQKIVKKPGHNPAENHDTDATDHCLRMCVCVRIEMGGEEGGGRGVTLGEGDVLLRLEVDLLHVRVGPTDPLGARGGTNVAGDGVGIVTQHHQWFPSRADG